MMIYDKPKSKPKATLEELQGGYLEHAQMLDTFNEQAVSLVGVRGYYLQTLGDVRKNDRIYYDDALFLIEKNRHFSSYNFNTDPSIFKHGVGTLVANEIYDVVKHKHKGQYNALQIIKDKLTRDGLNGFDVGRHGINFHYDAEWYSKHSLGCQTLPRSQWDSFIATVYDLMRKNNLTQVKYFLIEL